MMVDCFSLFGLPNLWYLSILLSTLKSLIDGGCGIVEVIEINREGWNSRDGGGGLQKTHIFNSQVGEGLVFKLLFSFLFSTMKTTELRTFVYTLKVK